MLRWVNAHKAATVGIVIGVALVAGSLLARNADTGTATATTRTSSPSVPGERAATSASPPTSQVTSPDASVNFSVPPPAVDPARLDFPTDPSGARQDRSEQGVRQVGLDYLGTVQQRFLYSTPAAGLDLLEAWQAAGVAAPELARTVERFDNLRAMLRAAGGEVWWLVSPLAVRAEAFDAARARVSVWTATVTAPGANPATGGEVVVPIVDYRTSTVELLWTDGPGWSVWDVTDVAGPVPMLAPGAAQSAPAEFIARLDGFALVKEHR